jgi:hypothetical protein
MHWAHLYPLMYRIIRPIGLALWSIVQLTMWSIINLEVFTIPHEFWRNLADSERNGGVCQIPLEFSWLEPQPFWFPIPWAFRRNLRNLAEWSESRSLLERFPLEFQPDSMEFQWNIHST